MFFKWHKKLVDRMSAKALKLSILGKILIALSLGSMFALNLVRFGQHILLISVILIVGFMIDSYMSFFKKKKISYIDIIIAYVGMILLVLFVGMQFSFSFDVYALILGVALLIPGLLEIMRNKK